LADGEEVVEGGLGELGEAAFAGGHAAGDFFGEAGEVAVVGASRTPGLLEVAEAAAEAMPIGSNGPLEQRGEIIERRRIGGSVGHDGGGEPGEWEREPGPGTASCPGTAS
jgi:hypothetical protein